MAHGHGARPWRKAMAQGYGAWPWRKAVVHGYGPWLRPMEQSQRAHMAAGSVAISGATSGFYWWKFEVCWWLFEAIFGAVFMYIRGLFSLIIRVVSRLHTSISNWKECSWGLPHRSEISGSPRPLAGINSSPAAPEQMTAGYVLDDRFLARLAALCVSCRNDESDALQNTTNNIIPAAQSHQLGQHQVRSFQLRFNLNCLSTAAWNFSWIGSWIGTDFS